MESTGVYWVPLMQILEVRGLEAYLVNAKHVKNVPGRRTDVSDCQWLQYLHSVGLLRASFRPAPGVWASDPCFGTETAWWRWRPRMSNMYRRLWIR